MAALSVVDRARVWRGLMRKWSGERLTCPFNKFALYDPTANIGAVVDTDNWIDTHSGLTGNTTGFNGALTVAMRAALTGDMKTDLLLSVAAMRRGVDYIRRLLGEVD